MLKKLVIPALVIIVIALGIYYKIRTPEQKFSTSVEIGPVSALDHSKIKIEKAKLIKKNL